MNPPTLSPRVRRRGCRAPQPGPITEPSLIARRISTGRTLAVASPDYLADRGVPASPRELLAHDCIVGFAGELTPERTWPLLDGGEVEVSMRLGSSDVRLRIEAARQHLGIALVPRGSVSEALAAGRLQPVLKAEVGAPAPFSLVFVDREFLPPQVRAFIDYTLAFFSGKAASTDRTE